MILADANAQIDPQAFHQFALIVSFLVSLGAGVASVAAFFHSRRTQRREVTFVREMASKEELQHVVKDIERVESTLHEIRADLKHHRELIEAAANARQDKLERRIESLSTAVTDLYRRAGRHES